MKRKRKRVQLHTYFIAAVLKGIAAIFYSTASCIIAAVTAIFFVILLVRALAFTQARFFIFNHIADKPDHDRPRCRSPPLQFEFYIKIQIGGNVMDEKRPKRRKDKYNPYTISKKGGCFFLSFKDGQGVPHHYEIDRPLFDLFDSFELEDKSYLNVLDRYVEQSELTEASLNKRAFLKPASAEDTVINFMQTELLHKLIAELPETQRRRLYLYYFVGLTYEQIAKIERCKKQSVCEVVLRAEEKIKEKIKKF